MTVDNLGIVMPYFMSFVYAQPNNKFVRRLAPSNSVLKSIDKSETYSTCFTFYLIEYLEETAFFRLVPKSVLISLFINYYYLFV